MTPKNPLWQLLEKLKAAFPEAVTETTRKDKSGKPVSNYAVTPEFIRQLQKEGMDFTGDNCRYELQFPGKQMARASALVPCNKTLLPDEKQSKNFRNTGNVFIEGDNLNALKLLQRSYRERVSVVYIDPPYNTGNDGFIYNDDFSVSQTAYLRATGVVDDDGVRQISEAQSGLRGRFHAGWMAFMYPRLKLARELLANDGVIFISIDDSEQANLKLLCDEIFGEHNFMANIVWHSTKSVTSTALISSAHTYNLIYAKNADYYVKNRRLFRLPESGKGFANPDNDPRGPWKADPFQVGGIRPNQQYEITNPKTGKVYKPNPGGSWKNDYKKFQQLLADNRIVFGVSGEAGPQRKRFLSEASERGRVTTDLWNDLPTNTNATTALQEMMGGDYFNNPKPTELVKRFTTLCAKSDGIVMDFFAGSGTTAHAVMELNAQDGGKRQFLLVQLAEKINKDDSEEVRKFCESLNRPVNIAEIAKERIRRAGEKIRQENLDWRGDNGFKVFTIEDSLLRGNADDDAPVAKAKQTETLNFKINLKPENFDAVLYETLLHTGAMLDQPLTTGKAGKYPFAICNRNCYCVTEKLTQDIAREIVEKHGDEFDMLYYLSDALESTTSYTQIESAVNLANKQAQMLAFY